MNRSIRSLFLAPLVACGLAGEPSHAAAPDGASSAEPDDASWVADLGHEKWARREAAEAEILRRGPRVIPLLLRAIESEDPEVTPRARDLIARIDPPWERLDLYLVELEPEVRLLRGVRLDGEAGWPLTPPARGGPEEAIPWTLTWRELPNGTRSLEAERRGTAGTGTSKLVVPGGPGPAVDVLESSVLVRTLRAGAILEDERRPRLLLVHHRGGRQSELAPAGPGKAGSAVPVPLTDLDPLVRALLLQARTGSRGAAVEAIDLLARMRCEAALERFRSALKDPDTAASGALGLLALGDRAGIELWRERLARSVGKPIAEDDAESRRLLAARLLARRGDPPALDHLIDLLERGRPTRLSPVLDALAAATEKIASDRDRRERFLDVLLTSGRLRDLDWTSPGVDWALQRSLELLDPSRPGDRARARAARSDLHRLVSQGLLGRGVPLAAIAPLWKLAERAASAPGDDPGNLAPLLAAALEAPSGTSTLPEVVDWIEEELCDAPLASELFERVVQRFESVASGKDLSRLTSVGRSLVELSRSLAMAPGQLAPWVRLLDRWTRLPVRAVPVRAGGTIGNPGAVVWALAGELARWTGVPAPERAGRAGVGSKPSPWTRWLSDSRAVRQREEELAAEGSRDRASRERAGRFRYCEFDLLRRGPARASSREGEAASLTLVGARCLDVVAGIPTTFRDARGLTWSVRIAPFSPAAVSASFRVHSRGVLIPGLPRFVTPVRRVFKESRFLVSEAEARPRALAASGATTCRTLALLLPLGADSSPGALPRVAMSAEELWTWLRRKHLPALAEGSDPAKARTLVQVLDALPIPGGRGLLSRLLDGELPAGLGVRVARRLDQLGDDRGYRWLLGRALDGPLAEAITACEALCGLGRAAGAKRLIELAAAPGPATQRVAHEYRVLRALEVYARAAPEDERTETAVATYLSSRLGDARWQSSVFRILRRIARKDFGYSALGRLPAPKRRQALLECVEKARKWLASRATGRNPAPSSE